MPTGYTSDLYDGNDVTLRDFILRCARGMGALIMMRDDPWDAPIRTFEPSAHHANAIEKTKARLDELVNMHPDEIARAAEEAHQKAYQSWRDRRDEKLALRGRYEDMLNKVRTWQPPTPEHEGLRALMVDQLESSIKFDCSMSYDEPPVRKPDGAWFTEQVERAQESLAYHVEEDAKERQRTADRNAWVQALMEALPEPASAS